MSIDLPWFGAGASGDDRRATLLFELFDGGLGVVTLVGDDVAALAVAQEVLGLSDIVTIPHRDLESDWIS